MSIFGLEHTPVGRLPEGRGITRHKFTEWEAHFPTEQHGKTDVLRVVTPADTAPPAEKLFRGVRYYRHRVEMSTKKVWYWRDR